MSGSMPLQDPAMTVRDLARYLRLAPGTIYNKVHRREIPFFKVGRALRFRRSEIDAWIDAQHPDKHDGERD